MTPEQQEKYDLSFYQIPDQKVIDAAGELEIKDEKDNVIKYKSLYTDRPAGERQLIVFIRHFFCGFCEDYVRSLTAEFTPEVLAAASTRLTIIGCGESICIPDYKTRTGCPFEIYCDPARGLYKKFDMAVCMRMRQRPSYLRGSMLGGVLSSTITAFANFRQARVAGPPSQNGGELIYEGDKLVWFHRMQDTADHEDPVKLKKQLAISE